MDMNGTGNGAAKPAPQKLFIDCTAEPHKRCGYLEAEGEFAYDPSTYKKQFVGTIKVYGMPQSHAHTNGDSNGHTANGRPEAKLLGEIVIGGGDTHIIAHDTKDGASGHERIDFNIGRRLTPSPETFTKRFDGDKESEIYQIARAIAENTGMSDENMGRVLNGFHHNARQDAKRAQHFQELLNTQANDGRWIG